MDKNEANTSTVFYVYITLRYQRIGLSKEKKAHLAIHVTFKRSTEIVVVWLMPHLFMTEDVCPSARCASQTSELVLQAPPTPEKKIIARKKSATNGSAVLPKKAANEQPTSSATPRRRQRFLSAT